MKALKSRIKIILCFIFVILVMMITSKVQAAGVDGTTIVLNPRAWWYLDRLCKWK